MTLQASLTGRVQQEWIYWMHLTHMATMDQISRLLYWKGKQEHARYSSQLLSHFTECVNTLWGCLFISISGAICVMAWHSSENRKWKLGQIFFPLVRCLSKWIQAWWCFMDDLFLACQEGEKGLGIIAKCHFIIGLFSKVLGCFLFQVGQYCSYFSITGWEVLSALFQGSLEYTKSYCGNLSHHFFL